MSVLRGESRNRLLFTSRYLVIYGHYKVGYTSCWRRQAVTSASVDTLPIGPPPTNLSEISIKIHKSRSMKNRSKMSSAIVFPCLSVFIKSKHLLYGNSEIRSYLLVTYVISRIDWSRTFDFEAPGTEYHTRKRGTPEKEAIINNHTVCWFHTTTTNLNCLTVVAWWK